MTLLDTWAAAWNIPAAAMLDLRTRIGIEEASSAPDIKPQGKTGSETRQQDLVLLDGAASGVWLTRNNVGALPDERGVPVRYGLANENKERNKKTKSADLIGVWPLLIGPHHVGKVIGQFVSVEMKHEGWTFNPKDSHEGAQLNWCNFILSKGGFACFATGPGIFKQPR